MLKREVTFTVRSLSNGIHRLMDSSIAKDWRITPMQGRFIGFIRRHQSDVFQRDLEAEFCIRRSTASAILQTMERDGLIRREAVPQDARLKKLVLTPKAEAFSAYFHQELTRVEALITSGISEEELDCFFRTAEKLDHNLSACVGENDANRHDCNIEEEKE